MGEARQQSQILGAPPLAAPRRAVRHLPPHCPLPRAAPPTLPLPPPPAAPGPAQMEAVRSGAGPGVVDLDERQRAAVAERV